MLGRRAKKTSRRLWNYKMMSIVIAIAMEAVQMKYLDFGNGNGVLVSDKEYNTYIRCKGCGNAGRIAVIHHLYGKQCPTCKGTDFDIMTRQQVDATFRDVMRNGYKRMSE